MAKSIEEILGREINSVKELRAAIREYQDSLIGVDAESQEFKDTTEKLSAAQDELNKVTRAGKDAMDAASDSIVGMERQYKDLYNQYKLLSEEQRNSDFGKEMAKSLETLSNKLNETKQGVGNFKDNIGRYTSSIMDAFSKMGGSVGGLVGPFKTATQGVQAFNATLKANPIGAVIALVMALVNVIKQLAGSIKDNEESQMRLNQAMASFQPIIDGVKNAFDRVGQAIVSVVEFIGKAIDKIRVAKAAFTDFLGITKGAKDAVKEQQKTYQELAKSINDLTKTKREYQKANAEDKAEVERLREEASETDNLVEKKKLLEEAKAKQAEIDQRNIEIAKEELRILEEQSKLTANDAAMNDKLAAAVAKVSEAEAQAASNMRNFNKQLNSTSKSTSSAGSAMKNLREEAKKLYEQTIENAKSEVQKLTEKYQKEKALLEKYHYDTKKLTEQYNKDLAKLQEETLKEAAEKSSKAYIDAAKNRINKGSEFDAIADVLVTNVDKAIIASNKMKAMQEEYNKFWEKFFNINFSEEGAIEKAKQFVNEINEILGINLQFPPEITDSSLEDFKKKLDEGKEMFVEVVKEMDRQAEVELKKDMAIDTFNSKMEETINKMIENVKIFSKETGAAFSQENLVMYNAFQENMLDEQLNAEIEYYKSLLDITELSKEERLQIMEQYYAALDEKRQRDLEKEQKALDLKVAKLDYYAAVSGDFAQSLTDSSNGIIGLANGYKTLYNAQLQEGKLNEKEVKAKKKRMEDLEKVVLAATIAQIAATTAQGLVDTWTGYIKETSVVNPQTAAAAGVGAAGALGVLNAASLAKAIGKSAGLVATAAGQIAAAKGGYISNVSSLRDEGSAGAAVASVSTPEEPDYIPFQYTRQVQTFAEEDELNRPIWVSVQDINSAQESVKVREEESSF